MGYFMGKNVLKICVCCAFVVTAQTGDVPAQTPPERLTFKQALDLAFDHNPQMVEAGKEVESAQGDWITARTPRNPEAEWEFGGFKKENGERDPGLDTFEVKQAFDPLGTYFYKMKMASNQVKVEREALRLAWASVYVQVRDIYSRIILGKKRLELADANIQTMRRFFGRVQERYQSGQVFKNELQRARIELLQAEHAYLAVQAALATDRARLNLTWGRPIETEFEIEEELKEERLDLSIERLKEIALTHRPDLKIAQLQLDSKKKNVIKEQLNRLPSYEIGFQRTENEFEDDYAVVIGISLPLWNFNHGEVKKAKAERDAQTARAAAVKNEAMFEVYEAYLQTELARKQLDLSKRSLREANELLRLADLHYSEGEIDFLNYLDQVKTAAGSRANYYEDLFHVSRSMSALEAAIHASLRQEDFFNEDF